MAPPDFARLLNAALAALAAPLFVTITCLVMRTARDLPLRERQVLGYRRTTMIGCGLTYAVIAYGSIEQLYQHGAYGLRIWLTTFTLSFLLSGLIPWTYWTWRNTRSVTVTEPVTLTTTQEH